MRDFSYSLFDIQGRSACMRPFLCDIHLQKYVNMIKYKTTFNKRETDYGKN